MAPAGSKSVRAAIGKYQPLLGLHWHIHESKGYFPIGKTICVNPGSKCTEGVLRGFLAELTEGKAKDFLFVSACRKNKAVTGRLGVGCVRPLGAESNVDLDS
jgi:Icc-related predicted phosphoesterase